MTGSEPSSAEPVRRGADRHLVYLDPVRDRYVSPYSPEGEIQMMGQFAAGLRRKRLPRPVTIGLVAVILLPIIVSIVAVISTWTH